MKTYLAGFMIAGVGLGLLLPQTARVAEKSKILVIRKAGGAFDEVYQALKHDLEAKFQVVDYSISKSTEYESVKRQIKAVAPSLLVLMDNQSVNDAIRYNAEQSSESTRVRGVALMGLNLKALLHGNTHLSGISYESPAYSLVTHFRFICQKPLKNVLVFYRKSAFQETMDASAKQLSTEGITLHAVDVEKDGTSKESIDAFVKKNVKSYLSSSDKYDVVWLLLDSAILSQELFQSVWLPGARESKIPFVTGAENFVAKEMNFATFAITPNLPDLANQAVQQVEAILRDHVNPKDLGVEDLISVNQTLNMEKAGALGVKLKPETLEDIKKIE